MKKIQFDEVKDFILNKLEKELPDHLYYHSVAHTLDVYESCKSIAQSEGINSIELKLLLTAALFHDAGFIEQAQNHEEISCRIARNILPDFNYSNSQIEQICGMIMATRIPQRPQNKLEEIMADSDLDYLGRSDFYTIGNTLKEELLHSGAIKNDREWNELQVKFLESHNYFTPTSIKLRKSKKKKHLEELRLKIA